MTEHYVIIHMADDLWLVVSRGMGQTVGRATTLEAADNLLHEWEGAWPLSASPCST